MAICNEDAYLPSFHLSTVELRCKLQEKLYRVTWHSKTLQLSTKSGRGRSGEVGNPMAISYILIIYRWKYSIDVILKYILQTLTSTQKLATVMIILVSLC